MKNVFILLGLGILLVSCGPSSKTTTNDLATLNIIKVTLDLTQTVDDKVPVTIDPDRFTNDTVVFRIPKVVQGTYSVSDFGNFIDSFAAYDYSGNAMQTTKLDTNSWAIYDATNFDKITYFVNDTFDVESEGKSPFSPSGTNIAPNNYVLNLHGFIGYFDLLKSAQYSIDVTAPINFVRTSALANISERISEDNLSVTTTYFAPRYFDVTDNPMMYGDLDVEEFFVGDIKIVLSIYSPNKVHTALSLKETVYKMMEAQKGYLGSINSTLRYDIYVYLSEGNDTSPMGFGALEHHTSTVVVMPESMPEPALANSIIDIVSHEFFHIVSPLSVHSEDVHYFDYNAPTFSKHLWMYEGVTEYFAQHFQVHQDLISEDEFFKTILTKIGTSRQLDDSMSFTVMSENVLDQPYASNYYNVYQKGALIGMCLDILIREESGGTRSMLSLMKELSMKYGKNKPFEDDKILGEIEEMTYPSVADFFNTHVIGTEPIDYDTFFRKVGLIQTEGKIESNFILSEGIPIVSGTPDVGIFFNELAERNTFWATNGIRANDVIKSVDGQKVTLENANAIFQSVHGWEVGRSIEIVLDREGEEIVIKTVTQQPYTLGKKLIADPNATVQQVKIRNAWLKG